MLSGTYDVSLRSVTVRRELLRHAMSLAAERSDEGAPSLSNALLPAFDVRIFFTFASTISRAVQPPSAVASLTAPDEVQVESYERVCDLATYDDFGRSIRKSRERKALIVKRFAPFKYGRV